MIAAVCIAVQALAFVPHHHHTHNQTPCFNIAHCCGHGRVHAGERHGGHDGCRQHNHCAPEKLPDPEHECAIKIDAAQVVSENSFRTFLDAMAVINCFFAPEIVITPKLACSIHSFSLTQWRQQPFPPDIYALFAAEALSVRAPSLLSV